MSPYFYNLEKPLISAQTRARLVEIGLEYGESIMSGREAPQVVSTATGVPIVCTARPESGPIGAQAYQKINDIQEIQDLLATFHQYKPQHQLHNVPLNIVYTLPAPEVVDKTRRHVDRSRPCAIVTPLWPIGEGYEPTSFWKDYQTDTPLASRGYEGGMPFLMNTHKLHSIEHYKCLRFNFQFSMAEDFQTVMNAMVAGTLFKPVPKEVL